MRQSRLIVALVLLGCVNPPAMSQGKLGHLKEWAGKYPTYNDTKPRREFLKLPEIQQSLLKLLPRTDYRFLTKTCSKEARIDQIESFLIVRRCHSYACGFGAAILIVNLTDGAMHVAISGKGTEQKWFSTNGKHKELPFDVKLAWFVTKKTT